jgi:hypothetical protein
MVRVPLPSGKPETKSIPRLASEYDTFERCLAYRDQRGREVWGARRWKELLLVDARSVARHREQPAGPITGVYHYERPTGTTLWVAAWYELMPDGSRKKRSAQFSYGTFRTRYATSEEAMQAAIKRRQEEEVRWYCVGQRDQRRVNQ